MNFRCVFIGDEDTGKTSLLMSYMHNVRHIIELYKTKTVYDQYRVKILLDQKECWMTIWDTSGCSAYSDIRQLTYMGADIFCLCFSIGSPSSFSSIHPCWTSSLSPNVPIVLVGTQMETRNYIDNCVGKIEAEEKAREIGAMSYVECSCVTMENVFTVFEHIVIGGTSSENTCTTTTHAEEIAKCNCGIQ